MPQYDVQGKEKLAMLSERWTSGPTLAWAFVVFSCLLIIFIISNIALMATLAKRSDSWQRPAETTSPVTSATTGPTKPTSPTTSHRTTTATTFSQPTSPTTSGPSTTPSSVSEVCVTSQCQEAAQDIVDSLDPSVDPCQDFYAYSCARPRSPRGPASTHLSVKEQLKDILETLQLQYHHPLAVKIAVRTYRTCMNPNISMCRDRMLETLKAVGPCVPCGDLKTKKHKGNWRELYMTNAYLTWGLTPFMDLGVVASPRGGTYTLAMDSPKHLFDASNASDILVRVSDCFFGTAANLTDLQAAISEESRTRRPWSEDVEDATAPKTLGDTVHRLQDSVWKKALAELTQRIPGSKMSEFMVKDEDYVQMITKQDKELHDIMEEEASHYTAAWFLAKTLHLWHDRLKNASKEEACVNLWERLGRGQARWESCLDDVYQTMPHVLQHLYASHHGVLNGKAEDFLYRMENSLRKLIIRQSWIDDASTDAALHQIRSLVHHVGYPQWILDGRTLDDYYKEVPMPKDDLLDNYVNLRRFHAHKTLELVSRDFYPTVQWPEEEVASPVDGHLAYLKPYNALVFPAGSQVPPLYHPTWPGYLNFGVAGTRIGRMLGRLLDRQASGEDLPHSWTSQARTRFLERRQCVQNQYEDLFARHLHRKENRSLSLSRDVADHIGLKLAYLAFNNTDGVGEKKLPGLERFTSAQMFFIAYAKSLCQAGSSNTVGDIHTPAALRVLGSVANMPEFFGAFNCTPRDSMKRDPPCTLL